LAEIDSGINGSSLEGVTDLEKETWNWGNWCVVVTEQQGWLSVQDFFLVFFHLLRSFAPIQSQFHFLL
jgi:hypothetical protein